MLNRLRNRPRGFTLIELLIVIAIIGIIAALLIPNLLDALQKSKQKRTMGDMRNIGTAMFSWVTDQVAAAAAGFALDDVTGGCTTRDCVKLQLVSQYIQDVPSLDGWKHAYEYRLDSDNPLASHVMAICSKGREGAGCAGSTDYTAIGFNPTDYDQDLVWADGYFVRWPQKLT